MATSGTANTGGDNKNMHSVFRVKCPPSVKECIQEEGRVGRQSGADHTTDWYCICISIESFLSVLRRALTTVGTLLGFF